MREIRFGPAGSSDSFFEMGYKHTAQMPEYLEKFGLNAFEYQCGRGVNVRKETAESFGALCREKGIEPSLHVAGGAKARKLNKLRAAKRPRC